MLKYLLPIIVIAFFSCNRKSNNYQVIISKGFLVYNEPNTLFFAPAHKISKDYKSDFATYNLGLGIRFSSNCLLTGKINEIVPDTLKDESPGMKEASCFLRNCKVAPVEIATVDTSKNEYRPLEKYRIIYFGQSRVFKFKNFAGTVLWIKQIK